MAWNVLEGAVSWFHSYSFHCGDNCHNRWDLQRDDIQWFKAFPQNLFTTTCNLLFMLIFLVILIISQRSRSPCMHYNRSYLHKFTTLLSFIIGLANIGVGLWMVLIYSTNNKQKSVLYCIQGSTWIVLACSLKLNLRKPPALLAITWWIIEFILGVIIMSTSIANIFETHTFSPDIILNITTSATCFLLFYCSIRAIRHWTLFSPVDLTEPLLQRTTLEETKVTPLNKASIFSRMTFRWFNSLLNLCYSKTLELGDIPHLVPEDEASKAEGVFAEACEHQRKQNPLSRPTVFRVLTKCYWNDMVVTGFFAFLRSIAMISGPLFLRSFIQFAGGKQSFKYEGFVLVGGLFAVKLVESFSQRHWYFNSRRAGMQMRSALMAAVYQKQLRLSNLARRRHAAGEIVNYIAVDAYRFGEFPRQFHWGWTVPFQMLVAISILFAMRPRGRI